jgi:UrcA family protein
MNRSIVYAFAFATFAAAAASAQAGGASSPKMQIVVSYGDLNVASEAGARALLGRIEAASRKICGSEPDIRDLKGHGLYASCVKSSMDRAVASLPQPAVAELYGERTLYKVAQN